jgi:hypothetical protein
MDEEKRAEGFLTLYKQQMQRFRETQGIEWKANFGVWTLLSGAIYFVSQHPITLPWPVALITCVGVVTGHGCWLNKIHQSEQFDKKLWVRYRGEALRLLRNGLNPNQDEEHFARAEWPWLFVVLWLTGVLSLVLFKVLMGGTNAGH